MDDPLMAYRKPQSPGNDGGSAKNRYDLSSQESREIYAQAARVNSRISTRLHRFWEALALLSGAFLMIHGMLSLLYVDAGGLWYFLSGVEACIGLVTVLVDGWFLIHV